MPKPSKITPEQIATMIEYANKPRHIQPRGRQKRCGDAFLSVQDGRFVMVGLNDNGPNHSHTLDVASTDAERLNAHWTRFCERRA